jgi:hypothetical protein
MAKGICECQSNTYIDRIGGTCVTCNSIDRIITGIYCDCANNFFTINDRCTRCPDNSKFNSNTKICDCNSGFIRNGDICQAIVICPVNSNWNPNTLSCQCI